MSSSYSSNSSLSKETGGSMSQRKLRRSSLALAGVNKSSLISESNDIPSPDSNASSEKSGKSGFSIFGLFTRKKADSEAELLKKDDSFSTFSTEECSSPSYSFSSSDNKILEDVPKRRFSIGLDSRQTATPIMINGSPIKISAKRQSLSLVNAPADRKSTKMMTKEKPGAEGVMSFRNPVMLFSGGRKSQTEDMVVTDSEVLSNSLSSPEDEDGSEDAVETEDAEDMTEGASVCVNAGKRRSSVTLTVPAAVIEAKGTAKAKYYFMRRSISCKTNPLEEEEADQEIKPEPPQEVPSSPSKAKFVLWQSVDEEENVDSPSDELIVDQEVPVSRAKQFETVVHDGRRLSVRAVSDNAPPAPAPPSLTPGAVAAASASVDEQEVVPAVSVVQTPDGRRLSVRAVSANAPPAPAPPVSSRQNSFVAGEQTVPQVTVVQGTDGRRLSVRAVSANAPPAPAPPASGARSSFVGGVEGDAVLSPDASVVVQSPDGRRLSVRAMTANAPPAPVPPKRDSDANQHAVAAGEEVASRRLSVRAVTEGAPAAPAPPPGRSSIRMVARSPAPNEVPIPTEAAVAAETETVQSLDGRRLSVRAVSAGAPPAPVPPKRDSVRVEGCDGSSTVMSPEGRRLSVRSVTENAPPAPTPPRRDSQRVVAAGTAVSPPPPPPRGQPMSSDSGEDVVVQSPEGRRLSVRAVTANAPPAPAPPSVRGSFRLSEDAISVDGRRLSVRAVSENAPPAPAPPRR